MVTTRRNVLQIHPSVLAKELTSKSKSIEAHNANIEQIREQNRIRRWDNESPAIWVDKQMSNPYRRIRIKTIPGLELTNRTVYDENVKSWLPPWHTFT